MAMIRFLTAFAFISSTCYVKATFDLNFDSDESCALAVNGANSIEGTEVVINAMRKGWWSCAEALAGNTDAEDLHSVVALESRTITTRIGSFKSAIESLRKPSQLITPAFQWAQSPDSIFLNVKFSHKLDAPATLDVIIEDVTLSSNSLKLKGSKDKKLFALDLTFFDEIDTDQSSWTTGSVGRIIFTIKKKGEDGKWPTLFPSGVPKLPQMHLWWDRQEEFQEALDKFSDDDDDEDDKRMKKDKLKKEAKAKEAKAKKDQDQASSGKKTKLTKKQKAQAKKLEQEAKELEDSGMYANMPEFALQAVQEIEEERKKQIEIAEVDNKQKQAEVEAEYKSKLEEIEKEFNALKLKIEQDAEVKRNQLKAEYNIEHDGKNSLWSESVDSILKAVDFKILSLDSPGDLLSKAATHVPKVEFVGNDDEGVKRGKVSLTHGVSEEHKVDTIWVVDEGSKAIIAFKDVASNMPELMFNIPKTVTQLKAFAHCNLHGVWSSEPLMLSASTDEL